MRHLIAALLLWLAAPAAAADCASAYANYEADWAITRAQWDADCAKGLKPAEILRARQQTFMAECAAHYRPFLAKARLEDWNLQVYCAQGAAGEAKLSGMTGAPLRRPPAPKEPDIPLNAARRYYNSVDTLGTEVPKNWDQFPGGILNSPTLRSFMGVSHDLYVNLAMSPPLCAMTLRNLANVSGRCGPGEPYIRLIVDKGCTGRVATMRVTDENGREMKCAQSRIDEIYSVLDAAYTAGRSRNGK
ncbi:MAG: hypothetical protein NDJ72_08275 [Elusimicrobia bacterium]|nr:hypothetical protein [Elusimicrobiota bacterium]